MRYQVWGLNRIQLFGAALLPLACWFVFRWQDQPDLSLRSFLHYYRLVLITVCVVYFLLTFAWVALMKRGIFTSRRFLYLFVILEFSYEIIHAVSSRDLGRIGLWMLLFAGVGALYRWLEAKIRSAHLNPRVYWYEGQPKVIPQVKAKLKIQDEWVEAGLRCIDSQGLFFFFKNAPENRQSLMEALASERVLAFELEFRTHQVEGEGKVSSVFSDLEAGIGLQFSPKDLYHFSQYTALVESLKGEGHV